MKISFKPDKPRKHPMIHETQNLKEAKKQINYSSQKPPLYYCFFWLLVFLSLMDKSNSQTTTQTAGGAVAANIPVVGVLTTNPAATTAQITLSTNFNPNIYYNANYTKIEPSIIPEALTLSKDRPCFQRLLPVIGYFSDYEQALLVRAALQNTDNTRCFDCNFYTSNLMNAIEKELANAVNLLNIESYTKRDPMRCMLNLISTGESTLNPQTGQIQQNTNIAAPQTSIADKTKFLPPNASNMPNMSPAAHEMMENKNVVLQNVNKATLRVEPQGQLSEQVAQEVSDYLYYQALGNQCSAEFLYETEMLLMDRRRYLCARNDDMKNIAIFDSNNDIIAFKWTYKEAEKMTDIFNSYSQCKSVENNIYPQVMNKAYGVLASNKPCQIESDMIMDQTNISKPKIAVNPAAITTNPVIVPTAIVTPTATVDIRNNPPRFLKDDLVYLEEETNKNSNTPLLPKDSFSFLQTGSMVKNKKSTLEMKETNLQFMPGMDRNRNIDNNRFDPIIDSNQNFGNDGRFPDPTINSNQNFGARSPLLPPAPISPLGIAGNAPNTDFLIIDENQTGLSRSFLPSYTKVDPVPVAPVAPVVQPFILTNAPVVEPAIVTPRVVEPTVTTTTIEPAIVARPVVEPAIVTPPVVEPAIATTFVEPAIVTPPTLIPVETVEPVEPVVQQVVQPVVQPALEPIVVRPPPIVQPRPLLPKPIDFTVDVTAQPQAVRQPIMQPRTPPIIIHPPEIIQQTPLLPRPLDLDVVVSAEPQPILPVPRPVVQAPLEPIIVRPPPIIQPRPLPPKPIDFTVDVVAQPPPVRQPIMQPRVQPVIVQPPNVVQQTPLPQRPIDLDVDVTAQPQPVLPVRQAVVQPPLEPIVVQPPPIVQPRPLAPKPLDFTVDVTAQPPPVQQPAIQPRVPPVIINPPNVVQQTPLPQRPIDLDVDVTAQPQPIVQPTPLVNTVPVLPQPLVNARTNTLNTGFLQKNFGRHSFLQVSQKLNQNITIPTQASQIIMPVTPIQTQKVPIFQDKPFLFMPVDLTSKDSDIRQNLDNLISFLTEKRTENVNLIYANVLKPGAIPVLQAKTTQPVNQVITNQTPNTKNVNVVLQPNQANLIRNPRMLYITYQYLINDVITNRRYYNIYDDLISKINNSILMSKNPSDLRNTYCVNSMDNIFYYIKSNFRENFLTRNEKQENFFEKLMSLWFDTQSEINDSKCANDFLIVSQYDLLSGINKAGETNLLFSNFTNIDFANVANVEPNINNIVTYCVNCPNRFKNYNIDYFGNKINPNTGVFGSDNINVGVFNLQEEENSANSNAQNANEAKSNAKAKSNKKIGYFYLSFGCLNKKPFGFGTLKNSPFSQADKNNMDTLISYTYDNINLDNRCMTRTIDCLNKGSDNKKLNYCASDFLNPTCSRLANLNEICINEPFNYRFLSSRMLQQTATLTNKNLNINVNNAAAIPITNTTISSAIPPARLYSIPIRFNSILNHLEGKDIYKTKENILFIPYFCDLKNYVSGEPLYKSYNDLFNTLIKQIISSIKIYADRLNIQTKNQALHDLIQNYNYDFLNIDMADSSFYDLYLKKSSPSNQILNVNDKVINTKVSDYLNFDEQTTREQFEPLFRQYLEEVRRNTTNVAKDNFINKCFAWVQGNLLRNSMTINPLNIANYSNLVIESNLEMNTNTNAKMRFLQQVQDTSLRIVDNDPTLTDPVLVNFRETTQGALTNDPGRMRNMVRVDGSTVDTPANFVDIGRNIDSPEYFAKLNYPGQTNTLGTTTNVNDNLAAFYNSRKQMTPSDAYLIFNPSRQGQTGVIIGANYINTGFYIIFTLLFLVLN